LPFLQWGPDLINHFVIKPGTGMALPHLIKYVYTNGTDEVIRRGKKIHAIGYVELVEYDELFESVAFRVKDDSYSTYYKVHIQKFKDPKSLIRALQLSL
jgi:hypothetical protein